MTRTFKRWAIRVRIYHHGRPAQPFLAGRYLGSAEERAYAASRLDMPEVVTFDTRAAARERCKTIRTRVPGWRTTATPVRVTVTVRAATEGRP